MITCTLRVSLAALLTMSAVACSEPPAAPTPPPANQPAPSTPAPIITVSTPTPVTPSGGAVSFGWPTFTVHNATKTNTTNTLVYRFDISNREDFATVAVSATVDEGAGQTSFTPPASQQAPAEGVLDRRALASTRRMPYRARPRRPSRSPTTSTPSKTASPAPSTGASGRVPDRRALTAGQPSVPVGRCARFGHSMA